MLGVDPVDELASRLFALDVGRHDTASITALMKAEIGRWALARGWSVRTEARVDVSTDTAPGSLRLGFIDVVVVRAGHEPDLAIEIDSGDKPWSVAKLRHAVDAGMHGVWVRWGDTAWAGWHADIDVIQLFIPRRAAMRRAADQLELGLRVRA